jgi:DNA-binding IclR family transcriptional regulator
VTQRLAAKEQRYIQSIEVGFQLIDVLRNSPRKLPLKEIAEQAGMTPTKAHLYLAAFARIGFVSQDPSTSRYGLGVEAVHIGLAAISQLDIVSASTAVMDDLFSKFDASVCLTIWGDIGPTIIRKLDPKQAMPNTLRIGSTLPLLWSSTGNVFLAFGSDGPMQQMLNREIAGRRDFKERADQIVQTARRQGFAWSESQMNQGFSAVSAPIFDHDDRLVGALTFVGLAPRIDHTPNGAMVRKLIDGAQQISRGMCQIDAAPPEQRGMQLASSRRKLVALRR